MPVTCSYDTMECSFMTMAEVSKKGGGFWQSVQILSNKRCGATEVYGRKQ